MAVQLIVFFEGTANTLRPPTTQVSQFAAACAAEDATNSLTSSPSTVGNKPLKMQFDGCGVTNGIRGVLFAHGLDDQCARVRSRVEELLHGGAPRVHVIALGLSRGGIACGKLALVLSATEELRTRVEQSMLLYDPVPGNFVWVKLPFTATGSQDLSSCTNLRDVLAIYPHEPLPALAVHAPLLFKYPPGCAVEEDVTLGCHQGALFGTQDCTSSLQRMVEDRGGHGTVTIASNLSFRRILDWFTAKGVRFEFRGGGGAHEPRQDECLQICRAALRVDWRTTRSLHDATGRGRTIVRRGADNSTRYLNRYHERLERGQSAHEGSEARYMLDFTPAGGGCMT